MTFEKQLEIGRVAEGLISRWIQARGGHVMPAYEIEKEHRKGPQLFSSDGRVVAPDMLVFNHGTITWIEAKHKSHFTWHRNSRKWTTGIDLNHYGDYFEVAVKTKLPVWLLFYHRESQPSADDLRHGCSGECPTGLFGGPLTRLVRYENHRAPPFDPQRDYMYGHGRHGMVHWAAESLTLLATTAAVLADTKQSAPILNAPPAF